MVRGILCGLTGCGMLPVRLDWMGILKITSSVKTSMHTSQQLQAATSLLVLTKPASGGGLDPTIIAALIGLGGVVVGALIAGGVAVYQTRRSARLQDVQNKQAQEMAHIQHLQAQEIARLQQTLQEQAQVAERKRQREEMNAETVLAAMLHATTRAERVQAYRDSLRADPRIARLQILDMERPLEITHIYVRVRLHQDTKMRYVADLAREEALSDPNALLKSNQLYLEQRVSSALDPEDAVRTYTRCVIIGDPGAGKTTLLKYLALRSVEQQLSGLPDIPIHIELNAFVSSGYQDLLDFAAVHWESRYGFARNDAHSYMQEQLQAGNAWLLLDALDETAIGETAQQADASYKRVTEAIMQQATRFHRAAVVVTARKAGYQQRRRLSGFTELEVLDFRPEDIRQFISAWFADRPRPSRYATAADLQKRLERNPRMQALAANPLLLSLIVLVYEEQLDLPEQRAELYNRCVETLLTKWDTSRDIRRLREFEPARKRQLLERVAWHFHLQGKRYFPEHELLAVIADFLPAIGLSPDRHTRILQEIAAENGLLKEQAQGWYGFLHLTLQEYFVAQFVTDYQHVEDLLEHRGEPWWEEVFLLCAGCMPDASPLLQQLLNLREDIFFTNLLLAGRCLAARPKAILQRNLREETISRLFQTLTTCPYALVHSGCAEALAEIGGGEVNTKLVELLADEKIDGSVRRNIASALGELGERTVAGRLVELLPDEKIEVSMRMRIAEVLGELGDRKVADRLVELLPDEKIDVYVRVSTAYALGELGERRVANKLVEMLADEKIDVSVRVSTAGALRDIGDMVVENILYLLSDNKIDVSVLCRIAETLGELGEQRAIDKLVEMLADEKIDVFERWSIAEILGDSGERRVANKLVEMLADEKIDISVRTWIVYALGKLGEQTVVDKLIGLLFDEKINAGVRWSIASTLGELGERRVADKLRELLSDEKMDVNMHWSIVYALGKLGERRVADKLVGMLADEKMDVDVRMRIAEVLGELGEQTVADRLVELLADEKINVSVRENIANALGELGERTVADRLVGMLADEKISTGIHESITNALRELGERTVVDKLVGLLANEKVNASVRGSIIGVLATIANDERTVRVLAMLYENKEFSHTAYAASWKVSQRGGMRVFSVDVPNGKRIEIVKKKSLDEPHMAS